MLASCTLPRYVHCCAVQLSSPGTELNGQLNAATAGEKVCSDPFVVWAYSLAGRVLARQLEGLFQRVVHEQMQGQYEPTISPAWSSETFKAEVALLQTEVNILL